MKRRFFIGLLSLLALAACVKGPEPDEGPGPTVTPSPALAAIDSLTWRRPDSALALLLPWFDTCRDAMLASPANKAGNTALETHSMRLYDQHYAHLLLAELLYKNDYAQTNRPELLQAVAYLDSLVRTSPPLPSPLKGGRGIGLGGLKNTHQNPTDDLFFLSARAHYINGVGYYEQDSVVQACREYLTALETMESRFDEKQLAGKKAKFMALTYTRLTEIFSDLYLHEQAIYFAQQSLCYYNKDKTTSWHRAWVLNEIGTQYDMLDNIDSADYYYRLAIDKLNDSCALLFRDIATHLTYLKYKTKEQTDTAVTQMRQLISSAEMETELIARYLTIGEIYYHDLEFDSALFYLEKVYQYSSEMDSKKQAAEWIIAICKAQGRDAEVLEYATFLVPFANQEQNNSAVKSQMTEIYNTLRQKKQEKLHSSVVKRNTTRSIAVMVVLVVVSVFYLSSKAKQKKLEVRQKETEKQLESERYAHEIQQKALAGRLRKSHDSLRLQSEMVAKLQESTEKKEPCAPLGDHDAFAHETPCHEIIERLEGTNIKRISVPEDYPELSLSPQQLSNLAKATEKHFPGFEAYLRRLYPRISALDIDICRLFLLGVNEKQVSILLRRDYSTIMGHVRKMKKALNIEKNLRDFIRNGE